MLKTGRGRKLFCPSPPLQVTGSLTDRCSHRGKHAGVAQKIGGAQVFQPQQIDRPTFLPKPIKNLVEETGVMTTQSAGDKQEGFGVDNPVVVLARLASNPQCRPLTPEKPKHNFTELILIAASVNATICFQ